LPRLHKRFCSITKGFNKTTFLADDKTQSAVVFQLLIVGEAVKHLSQDFRNQHSTIPWSLIAGMRDNLIHKYDAIDWDEVWKTVSTDIPDLLDMLQPFLTD
jgi:uncharacterized protein with HEPN domain